MRLSIFFYKQTNILVKNVSIVKRVKLVLRKKLRKLIYYYDWITFGGIFRKIVRNRNVSTRVKISFFENFALQSIKIWAIIVFTIHLPLIIPQTDFHLSLKLPNINKIKKPP